MFETLFGDYWRRIQGKATFWPGVFLGLVVGGFVVWIAMWIAE